MEDGRDGTGKKMTAPYNAYKINTRCALSLVSLVFGEVFFGESPSLHDLFSHFLAKCFLHIVIPLRSPYLHPTGSILHVSPLYVGSISYMKITRISGFLGKL